MQRQQIQSYIALLLAAVLTASCGNKAKNEDVNLGGDSVSNTSTDKQSPEAVPENFGKPWAPSPEAQKQIDSAMNKFDHAPGWIGYTSTDEMTDMKIAIASIEAVEPVQVWLKSVRPSLVLRCTGKKTEAIIVTKSAAQPEVGNFQRATVSIRFDDKKPYTGNASVSTNNEALFLPGPTNFAKKTLAADLVMIQFTPFNSSPVTAKFAVKNSKFATEEAKTMCKW